MSDQPIGHRPINWGAIGVIVTLVLAICSWIFGFGVLSERQTNQAITVAEHTRQIEEIKGDDRTARELSALRVQQASMQATLESLRDEVKDLKRKR